MMQMPEKQRVEMAELINSLGLSWTASSYTEKDHSFAQVGSAGMTVGEGLYWQDVFDKAQLYLKNPDRIGRDSLPSEFNWENFHGYNFVGDVADQGGCGSCYVVASNTMLESRIMLFYGEKHDLSS
jgi:Papain family cysteine protease